MRRPAFVWMLALFATAGAHPQEPVSEAAESAEVVQFPEEELAGDSGTINERQEKPLVERLAELPRFHFPGQDPARKRDPLDRWFNTDEFSVPPVVQIPVILIVVGLILYPAVRVALTWIAVSRRRY